MYANLFLINWSIAMNRAKILLIYTGGTTGWVKILRRERWKHLILINYYKKSQNLKLLDCEIETFSFENLYDSSNMNPEMGWNRHHYRNHYAAFDGFVVLHGSDTMS
jgi:L-asparaginase